MVILAKHTIINGGISMSLNNIVDDILLIVRNNNLSESEHLSRI
jgi:hypothetical protein